MSEKVKEAAVALAIIAAIMAFPWVLFGVVRSFHAAANYMCGPEVNYCGPEVPKR